LYARQFATTDDAFIEGNITLVSSKISAHVARLHVTENQYVKKGDLLIEFDAQEAEAKLAQAKAALQTTIAALDKAKANVALTRVTSRAGLNQANSNLQTARTSIEQTKFASSAKRNAVEQSQNQKNTAEANLRQVQAQIPAAEAAIAQALAQVSAAKNKLEVARLEHERDKTLSAAGDVSRQQLDLSGAALSEAQAGLVSAEKQVEIAESRLNAQRRQVEVEASRLNEAKVNIAVAENDYQKSVAEGNVVASQADESAGRLQEAEALPSSRAAVEQTEVEAAEAQIAQAQAAVSQAELQFGYTKIYAPQDGFVSRKSVQEGQLVQPEQGLMTITQGGIWVVANFKETQLEKMQIGQNVDIFVDAYPGAVFHGKIEGFQAGTGSRFSVLPAENASGNFVKVVQRVPVKIIFDQAPDSKKYLLVPGMSVVPRVRIR
ncbi:MAG: HlyD family secretion protein, partial [Acidobacteriota bacterium]|nr:HlyD family secretion protein [Acidobacteriota bacterium]